MPAVQVNIGRDLAGGSKVADQSDLQGANKRITPTFQPGRNLLTKSLGIRTTPSRAARKRTTSRSMWCPTGNWNDEQTVKGRAIAGHTTVRTAAQP